MKNKPLPLSKVLLYFATDVVFFTGCAILGNVVHDGIKGWSADRKKPQPQPQPAPEPAPVKGKRKQA